MEINLKFFFGTILTSIVLYQKFFKPSNSQAPTVNAPVGDIKGTVLTSKYGRNIFSYTGIPYAKPPIGNLRFKRPETLPDNSWEGVFDASKSVTKCVQISEVPMIRKLNGAEDCLQLNVYVPQQLHSNSSEKGLPVMVWFHGGGYTSGDSSARLYGPEYLLDKDVILVTSNYRLGIFGFLTLGHEDLSGNQGMWDQLEALKWVQRNIASFGGNKNKVTIFGESAGGYSISYHLTSHQSKDYFQAAIIQSGPLEKSGYTPPPERQRSLVDIHQEFASRMGCPLKKETDMEVSVKCLQEKSVSDLMNGLKIFDQCNTLATGMMAFPVVWAPVSDFMYVKNPFFEQDPLKLMVTGQFNKVPTMIGTVKDEGLLHTATLMQNPKLSDYFKMHWDQCAANSFLNTFFIKDEILYQVEKDVIQSIEDFYFDGTHDFSMDNWKLLQNLSHAFGDSKFLYGTDKMAHQLAKHTKTYYYHFDHLGSYSLADVFSSSKPELAWNLVKKMLGFHHSKKLGVCHADDILYLFKSNLPIEMLPDERDQNMIDFTVNLWTNFATFHDPTPSDKTWLPCEENSSNCYVILDDSKLILERDPKRQKRIDFWKNIPSAVVL